MSYFGGNGHLFKEVFISGICERYLQAAKISRRQLMRQLGVRAKR
jgi:hypothetical protein